MSCFGACDSCGVEPRVLLHSEDRGQDGAFTLVCDQCGWEQYVPEETTARSRIDALRQIVREHSARRIDGYLVDATTASMLVTIYDALPPASREKFGKPSMPRLVNFGWQHVRPA